MKRFHVSIAVTDLQRSVDFYTTLFAAAPGVLKSDYARWMLDDPRLNFSISESRHGHGISHVGLQMDSIKELTAIQEQLQVAGENTVEQPEAECCYAKSSKTWVRDPDNVAWEAFVTHGAITHYGTDIPAEERASQSSVAATATGCCKSESATGCCV